MSDPDVIADRERYAEVGRRTAHSSPHQLARSGAAPPTTPPGRASCSPRAATTPSCASCSRPSEERLGELEEEIRLAMVEPDPNDERT